MTPELVYLGITHKTAPVSIRERFRPDADQHRAILRTLADQTHECALLNTCGRVEIYALADRPDPDGWITRLAAAFDLPHAALPPYFRALTGDDCAKHLLRVAAGLESQIIGETYILNQIRKAHQSAIDQRSIGPVLSALLRAAIHTGRRVRREPWFDTLHQTLPSLTLDRIATTCNSDRPRIVVVGGGHIATDMIDALAGRYNRITIVNRNIGSSHRLANRVNGVAAGISELPTALRDADAAVVCTASPAFVIDSAMLQIRTCDDITLIDLSVPRNVDPRVARLPHVRLTHLDQLAPNRRPMTAAIADVESVIQEQLDRFSRWRRARAVASRIKSLVRSAENGDPDVVSRRKRALHRPITTLIESATA